MREVINTANWVIHLEPEGGDKGGEIVAVGTPEEVAKEKRSYTGHYLRLILEGRSTSADLPPLRLARERAPAE